MQAFLSIIAMFSGPIGQLALTGITSGGAFLTAWMIKQGVDAGSAGVIASGLVTALSGAVQVLTGNRTVQIKAVNMTDNGVRVVPTAEAKAAGIAPAQEPLK